MSKGRVIVYIAMILFALGAVLSAIFAGIEAYRGDWTYVWILMGIAVVAGVSLWFVWRTVQSVFNEMDEHEHSER